MQLNPIVDSRDVHFILFEMLKIESLLDSPLYSDFDKLTLTEVLDLAETIAVAKVYPGNSEADKKQVQYKPDTGEVIIPDELTEGLKAYYEAGFIGISQDTEIGGMGMPACIGQAVMDYFTAASVSFSLFPALSHGVIDLVKHYYSGPDKQTVLDRLLSGEWGGTMCLTEPEAGSDVGALRSRAIRLDERMYSINGNKIFISSGDGNFYKNIIHTVLARVTGDPTGTKGISIFLTPKYRYDTGGEITGDNDVVCSGIEHKMGIGASPTCSLNFGEENGCTGTLIGEARKGMRIMFHMMNEARLFVGLQGMSLSSAAYMHAVTYARNRVQGIDISDMLKPDPSKVTISKHPDVKRLLLSMKSKVEAMRSLIYFNGYLIDLTRIGNSEKAKEAQALIDFLIPITKAGNTDLAWHITGDAIQVYGGYGYSADYPVEQYAREAKILSLYEGTNGIQAIDLIMRKLLMNENNYNYSIYKKFLTETVNESKRILDPKYSSIIEKGLIQMDRVVVYLQELMKKQKFYHIFADAGFLCNAFAFLTYAWMHLWSLNIVTPKRDKLLKDVDKDDLETFLQENREAAFYQGRVLSGRYYINIEFNRFFSETESILNGDTSIVRSCDAIFTGAPEE